MKLTLFGDNNRKSSNERLQKNVLDELKANGLLPVITELFKEAEEKGATLKNNLMKEGLSESEAREIAKKTQEEVMIKVLNDINRYIESLPKKINQKNLPPPSL